MSITAKIDARRACRDEIQDPFPEKCRILFDYCELRAFYLTSRVKLGFAREHAKYRESPKNV